MKIIKNNYNEPKQFTCECCGSVLEVDYTDVIDPYDECYFRCPLCYAKNFVNMDDFKI